MPGCRLVLGTSFVRPSRDSAARANEGKRVILKEFILSENDQQTLGICVVIEKIGGSME